MKSPLTLSTLLVLFLCACQKNVENNTTPPNGQNCRMAKIIQGFSGDDTTFTFIRNADGAINGIEYAYDSYQHPFDFDTLHIVLDSNSRPWARGSAPGIFANRTMGWDWSSNGRLMAHYAYDSKYSYYYTSDSILSGISYSLFNSQTQTWQIKYHYELEFDKDGDITAMNTPYGWNRYTYYDIPSSIGDFLQFNVSNELGMRDVGVYPFAIV